MKTTFHFRSEKYIINGTILYLTHAVRNDTGKCLCGKRPGIFWRRDYMTLQEFLQKFFTEGMQACESCYRLGLRLEEDWIPKPFIT